MLTTAEAGKILGVNASRVRQLIIAGRITPIRVGARGLYIDEAELRRYIREAPTPRQRKPRTPKTDTKTDVLPT